MLNVFLSLLNFGPKLWIGAGVGIALGATGLYLRSAGYQQGYEKATLRYEARIARADAAAEEALREAIAQQQVKLEELIASNRILSDKVNAEKEIVIQEIERVVKEQPIIVDSATCQLDYSVVGLLNTIAGTTSSSN